MLDVMTSLDSEYLGMGNFTKRLQSSLLPPANIAIFQIVASVSLTLI